jgi:hypothetical protein
MSQLSADDRAAIAEVLAAYCWTIDHGRWDELPALFSDDCRLDFGAVMGIFEGPDGLQRFAETLRGTGLFMRHYVTNVVLRGDGARAEASSYVLAITGPPGGRMTTTGRYEDELVKVAGRWRIRRRRAVIELGT